MSKIEQTRALYDVLINTENLLRTREYQELIYLIPLADINTKVYNAQDGTLIYDEEPDSSDELQSLFHMFLIQIYPHYMLVSTYSAQKIEKVHALFLESGGILPNAQICNKILGKWRDIIDGKEVVLKTFKEAYSLYDTKCRNIATNTIKKYDAPHRYIDDSLHRMYHPEGKLAQGIWSNVDELNQSYQ